MPGGLGKGKNHALGYEGADYPQDPQRSFNDFTPGMPSRTCEFCEGYHVLKCFYTEGHPYVSANGTCLKWSRTIPMADIPKMENNKDSPEAVNKFKNDMATAFFGMSREDALAKGLCVKCHQVAYPKCHSNAGYREYKISAICEECFDKMFEE